MKRNLKKKFNSQTKHNAMEENEWGGELNDGMQRRNVRHNR
jgi:hypothetical protein